MAGEWIGVAGTVIGIVVGGSVTYFVTRAKMEHEEKLERNRRQLSKLEAIHALFSKIVQQTNLMSISVIANLTDGIAIDPKVMGDKLPLEELQMHADIYIPEVSSKVNDIFNKWMDFGRVLAEVILKPSINDNERKNYILKSQEIAKLIDGLCKEAKQIVVDKARKHL